MQNSRSAYAEPVGVDAAAACLDARRPARATIEMSRLHSSGPGARGRLPSWHCDRPGRALSAGQSDSPGDRLRVVGCRREESRRAVCAGDCFAGRRSSRRRPPCRRSRAAYVGTGWHRLAADCFSYSSQTSSDVGVDKGGCSPRERESAALARRRGSGRQQAHPRVPQPRQSWTASLPRSSDRGHRRWGARAWRRSGALPHRGPDPHSCWHGHGRHVPLRDRVCPEEQPARADPLPPGHDWPPTHVRLSRAGPSLVSAGFVVPSSSQAAQRREHSYLLPPTVGRRVRCTELTFV